MPFLPKFLAKIIAKYDKIWALKIWRFALINPKISIIIPVYNVEKYLKDCLDSCINQTLQDIEIIIIDDCGSDGSMDIARQYALKDNRIKIIKNSQNMGPFATRNYGASQANGEYLLFLDSDDFLDPKACEIALNSAKDGHYDIVTFGSHYWSDEASEFAKFDPISFENGDEFGNWLFRSKNISWNLCFRLIKRDIYLLNLDFLTQGKSRLIMAEDMLAMFAIFSSARCLVFIPDMLYYYRYNPNSSTNDTSVENLKNSIKSFEEVNARMREFALQNRCDKKWQKLYIKLGQHECKLLKRALKIKEGKFGLMDKISAFIDGRLYVLRRKFRVKFGI